MLLGEREMMRHNMLYIKPNFKNFEIHNQKLHSSACACDIRVSNIQCQITLHILSISLDQRRPLVYT